MSFDIPFEDVTAAQRQALAFRDGYIKQHARTVYAKEPICRWCGHMERRHQRWGANHAPACALEAHCEDCGYHNERQHHDYVEPATEGTP